MTNWNRKESHSVLKLILKIDKKKRERKKKGKFNNENFIVFEFTRKKRDAFNRIKYKYRYIQLFTNEKLIWNKTSENAHALARERSEKKNGISTQSLSLYQPSI